MAKVLEIAQLGNPVLRKTAQPVSDPAAPEFTALLEDLFATVAAADGAGIAAPQVSQSERVFIVCSNPTPRYPYAPVMDPTVIINPRIEWFSEEFEKDWEGCLSIPGLRARVPRSKAIRVQYLSPAAEVIEAEFSGFIARVFQHEIDHLDGIVYLDRVEDSHDIVTEQEFQKRIAAAGRAG